MRNTSGYGHAARQAWFGLVLVACALPFLLSGPALAQEGSDRPPPETEAEPLNRDASLSAESSGNRRSVEEIVVRARKRSERLEETPVAVTALGEDTLREAGVTRLDQIQDLVPNLLILGSDSNIEGKVVIRGIGASQSEMAFDPGVGVFIDGVFLPRAIGSLLDVVDVEQIEVLRGPQGTLFGKNTVGGAINISTVRPHSELEAFAMVRPGTRGILNTRMMLNLPIAIGPFEDRLFARIAFASVANGGYVENVPRNQEWSNRNSLSFLGSLRWIPVDDLTIDLSGSWSRDHSNAAGGQCTFIQDTGLQTFYAQQGIDFREVCDQSQPFRNWSNVAQISDSISYGTWATAAWDIGEVLSTDLSFKSITSWREQKYRLRQDFDGTPLQTVEISNAGGGPLDGTPGSQRQIQQEVQLNGTSQELGLDFVLGYFVLWERGRDRRAVLSGFDTAVGFGVENDTSIDNWTWALFGQATYSILDWLSLTGGLRYSEDKKGVQQTNQSLTDPDAPPQIGAPESAIFSSWTPMGTLSVLMPDDWLGDTELDSVLSYFTYARGFKGGGFNGVLNPSDIRLTDFQPETLDSFELGFKLTAFEQRLSLNLALFLGLYDDIQVTQLLDVSDPTSVTPNFVQVTQNAAEATTQGIELEFLTRPVDGLQINGSVGFLDAFYDSFTDTPSLLDGQSLDRSGQRFSYAPELQTHVAVQYSFELDLPGPAWMDGWLTPRADWSYQSTMFFEGPEVWSSRQPGYNLLHLRLSYDFLDDRAQVALWGQNVTDQRYLNWSQASTVSSWGSAIRFWGQPVTWGGEISYRF